MTKLEGHLHPLHPLMMMARAHAEKDNLSDLKCEFLIKAYVMDRKGRQVKIDLEWNKDNPQIEFRDDAEKDRFLRAVNWAKVWFLNR